MWLAEVGKERIDETVRWSDEFDISEVYEEGMTWRELSIAIKRLELTESGAPIGTLDGYQLEFTNTMSLVDADYNYYAITLDGNYILSNDVVDLSVTYTLTPIE